jgi:hypothetical protein
MTNIAALKWVCITVFFMGLTGCFRQAVYESPTSVRNQITRTPPFTLAPPSTATPIDTGSLTPPTQTDTSPSRIVTVCLSGACDYTTIQAAIDASHENCLVKVAAGTYTDVHRYDNVTQTVYISKTLTIQGGYTADFTEPANPEIHPTILDARGQGRVLYVTGNITPTIAGLQMTGGHVSQPDDHYPDDVYSGGGVYVITATAILRNNHIFGNQTDSHGGGIALIFSHAVLEANLVTTNSSRLGHGGGLFLLSSQATLISNTVTANTANFGGGLYLLDSAAVLNKNTIANNMAHSTDPVLWGSGGGGLYLETSPAVLADNLIFANKAERGGGGIALLNSPATMSNNTIADNTASWGGGLSARQSGAAKLTHNIITGNTATKVGGGLDIYESDVELVDNIIIANTATWIGGVFPGGSRKILANNVIRDNIATHDIKIAGFSDSGAQDVTAVGHYVYIADGRQGLKVLDISAPAEPEWIGSLAGMNWAQRVVAAGNYVYIVDRDQGLRIVDVSNPAMPVEVGFYKTLPTGTGVAIAGDYAYMSISPMGNVSYGYLEAIDISDPATPTQAGIYKTPAKATDVAISDEVAYVSYQGPMNEAGFYTAEGGLIALDITDPTQLKRDGMLNDLGHMALANVVIAGQHAYLNSDELKVVDISDPIHLRVIGSIDLGSTNGVVAQHVAVSAHHLYFSNDDDLRVVDISHPNKPKEIASFAVAPPNYMYGITTAEGYIILGSQSGLFILEEDIR